jgi:hypothetical protein
MVDESPVDFNLDDWSEEDRAEADRREPQPSTWFDDLDSGPMPLETQRSHAK